jgi:hypothetical protein
VLPHATGAYSWWKRRRSDLCEILVAARDMMLLDLIEKSIMISQTTLVLSEYFETFDAHG